jgi:hypothetical protein
VGPVGELVRVVVQRHGELGRDVGLRELDEQLDRVEFPVLAGVVLGLVAV